jgi:PST family polysaccharide transporter
MTIEGAKPAEPLTPAEIRHLDRKLVSGFAWTAGAKWSLQLASWASMLVLAHLLDPADFGIVSMGALLFGFVSLASQFGIDGALIVSKEMTEEQMRQLNAVAVLLGFAGFLVCLMAAGPVSAFFRTPALMQVIPVMALGFPVSGLRVVPQARLEREMRFRATSLIEVLQSVAQAATAITCALFGLRYWSIVFGSLAGTVIATALPLVLRATGYSRPRLVNVGVALSFSWKLLVSRLCWYVYTDADFLIVGRVLGQTALGFYSLAWNLANMPIEKIVALLTRVTPTVLAKAQRDLPAMRRYYRTITEMLALATFPLALGMALVAQDAIPLFLGQKWTAAVLPLQLLCCSVVIRALSTLPAQFVQILNDMVFNTAYSVAMLVLLPLGFYFSSRWGIAGVAGAWLFLGPLAGMVMIRRALWLLAMPVRELLGALRTPAIASLLMVIATAIARACCHNLSTPVRLAIVVSVGAATFSAVVWPSVKSRAALFAKVVSQRASG